MQKQELFERIEAYLNRTLSPEELQAWEQRLVDEPDLRQSVELHRTLHQDYDTGRLQLRANLREVMQEPLQPDPPMAAGGKLRWGIWIGIVGLAIVIGWIFWPGHTNTAPLLPEAAPVVLPPAPSAPVP
ncbi:MAG: hypothetical protein ABIQ93_13190, partial [Saprospiraceae bacterium]